MSSITIGKIVQLVEDPYQTVAEFKKHADKRVIGCFPMEVPEELIHAAGFYPIVIWVGNEPVTIGHSYTMYYNCAIVRTFIDDIVRGRLWFMDGIIVARQCLPTHELAFVVERNAKLPYLEYLYLPALYPSKNAFPSNATRNFTIYEFKRLKNSIEKFSGKKIDENNLIESIKIYNENRKLLRDIYELRRKNPQSIRAWEMVSLIWSSMIIPKEEHSEMLKQVLEELKGREVLVGDRLKVILVGCMCHVPRSDILRIIEDLGMVVVDDDIYVGSRYIYNDVKLNGDPIISLVERYFSRIPPTLTKGDWEIDWGKYIVDMVKKVKADGVVTLMPKFCPPHLCNYPDFKRTLIENNIPEVLIEMEHEAVTLETVRLKLQAFTESLRRR